MKGVSVGLDKQFQTDSEFLNEFSHFTARAKKKRNAGLGLERALYERTTYKMLPEGSDEERALKKQRIADVNRRIAEFIAIIHRG